jgi:hypothetical protein
MSVMPWRDRIWTHSAWQYPLAWIGSRTGAWGRRTIVVLSSYRFGSSLMMNYLHNQPNIRRRGEILNPDESVYGNFRKASVGRVIMHIKAMCFAPRGRMTMVKLMDSQLEDHGLVLDDIIAALDRPYIVAVYRRDLLSAYVSLRIAEANGIWYSTELVNNESISIEIGALKNYVSSTRQRWTHSAVRMRAYDRAVVVAYEDMSEHPERIMNNVFDVLQLPHRGTVTETVRQNPAPPHEKIKNYLELGLPQMVARGELTLDLEQILRRGAA